MKKILAFLVFLPFFATAQNKLSISVEGVKSSAGRINVAVYNKSEGFLKFDEVYKSDSALASRGTTHIDIGELPEGIYALAIFHDENGNNELDTNWLGLPKESFGFSRGSMKAFGPPSFRECAMRINTDSEIRIIL